LLGDHALGTKTAGPFVTGPSILTNKVSTVTQPAGEVIVIRYSRPVLLVNTGSFILEKLRPVGGNHV
jgi:hypothetical protein